MTDLIADAFRTLGPVDAIPDGFAAAYYLADRKRRITIARADGQLYAFDDLCTCAANPCPLSGGLLTGTMIMCQCHGSEWDITTGDVVSGQASQPLSRYEVHEADGRIRVRA